MTTPSEQVQVLLELAGIKPSTEEMERLAVTFEATRAAVERLWALDLGYTPPSLVFRAAEPVGPGAV